MSLQNQTVIVAEDTYDDMQLISTILTHSGIKVKAARNGRDCLELIREEIPGLIVTDLSMPEMDGWELLKQLRANPATEKIPVVVVTAYYSVDVAQAVIEAGFDGYFAKPVSATQFVKSLEKIVGE